MNTKTPEEANELWCPMSRVLIPNKDGTVPDVQAGSNRYSVNGEPNIPKSGKCIAERCAMWRWDQTSHINGYCGLAPIHTLP